MKKRLLFRALSTLSALSLVLQLASPALPALALDPVTSTLVTVKDITNDAATVCFTLSGSGYGKIHYGTTSNYGLTAQEESVSTCNGVSSKIIRLSGLSLGTTVNYKIVSWPSSGTESSNGSSSQNYTFTTLASDTASPGAMADAKANLGKAATVSSNSVTVFWKTPGDNGWNAGPGPTRYEVNIQKMRNPSTGQYVTLFQMPGDGGFWDSAKARISTDFPGIGYIYAPSALPVQMGAEQSLTVTGLAADTDYRIGVIAYDAVGNVSPNPPAIFDVKTGPAVDINAPHQIGSITASGQTTSGFTISWAAPIDYDKNFAQQSASYYDIRYKEGTSFLESDWTGATRVIGAPAPAAPGTTQSLAMNSLKADTNYVVGFKSTDSANNTSQLSISPTIRTLPAPVTPDTTAPDRISLTGTYTSAGVSLTWLSPQDTLGDGTKGPATRYEVRYNATYGSQESEWWQSATTISGPPAPVSMNTPQTFVLSSLPLSASKDYYFSIKAFDAAGNGSLFSLPTLVRTPAVSPGANNFPSGTARLEVTVSAPATSAGRPAGPVDRAIVQLTSSMDCSPAGAQGTASGETGSSGYYSFPGVPAGSYKLTVSPPADNSRTDLMQMNWGCIQLTADSTKNQPVMMPISSGMPPTPTGIPSGTSSITVVVNDYTGIAVADPFVEIQYCGVTSTNPCVTASLQKTAISNEYRISNIGAGNYSIRVMPPGSRSDLVMKEWFGISPALTANDPRREYVSLQKREMTPPGGGGLGVGTATLEVVVKSPSGTTVDAATVGLSRSGNCPGQSMTTQGWTSGPTSASGFIAFNNIPSGTYTLGAGPGANHTELGNVMQVCVTLTENQRLTHTVTLPWSTTTPPPGVAPTLTNVYASNMTMSSADVYFTVTNAVKVTSEYRMREQDPWSAGPSHTFAPGESGQRILTLTGLSSNTTYYYRLTAHSMQNATMTYPQNGSGASFATMAGNPNPGSTLPPGDASLKISVVDSGGVPLVGAMVGVSSCTSSMSSGSNWSSGSTWSSQPCSWAGGRTTMINGRAFYIITGIMAREYNIGVSPPDGRYADFEPVTSWPVTLPANAKLEETIPLKPKGGTIVTDLPIVDLRMETSPAADVSWITWNTPREADGRIEYGTMQTYELGSIPIPGFSYRHETKFMVKPNTTYYYKIVSTDRDGRSGTMSGQFTTPGAGDQLRPFMIDWGKTWPHANERVDTSLKEIHVEFTRAIDESSLLPGIASLFTLDKTHSPRAEVKKNYNGFSLVLFESLKPNSAYMVTIRGSVRAADGVTLGSEQYLQFSTGEPGDGRVGKGAITGVVKLLNGSSVENATVMLRGESGMAGGYFEQKTQTSHSGDYSFRELPAGTYRIMVYPPSHLGSYNTPPSPPLTVGDNQVLRNDIVLLVSEYVVEGSVTYEDGSPVNDAYVGAWRTEGSQWTPPIPVDPQGHFRLLVGPGAWSIGVMNRPMGRPCDSRTPCPMTPGVSIAAFAPMAASITMMPEYYPDWYPPKPQPVFFNMDDAEKTQTVNFKVSRSRASSSIAGVVQNPDGSGANPLTTKVRIFSRTGEKNFSRAIEISSGGAFSSPLPAGSYEIRVETSDPDLGSPMPFDVHIAPGEQKAVGTLTLTKTNLSISGTVKKASGKPAAGVRIEGWNKETNETVPDVTNDKGAYRLKVSMGNWIVRVASTERYSGGRESTEFVPASRLPASGVDFTVDENTTLIRGTFKNPEGALLTDVFGYVRVLPGKRAKKPLFMMLPGAPVERGEFNLSLPEGNYILEFEPPQGSRYFQAKPASITVESGDTLQVTVIVEESTSNKGATITGNLVDTSGSVIKSVPFTVYAGSGGRWLSAEGDPKTGSYTLPIPPAKKYAIGFEVRSDEYIKSSAFRGKTIDRIEAGETRSLNLTVVRRSVQLTGKVVDSENDPVADIDVVLASEPFYGGKTTFRDVQTTYSDDDGSFDFRVQPGVYYMRALVPDTSEYVNPEEQRVDVKPGSTGLAVVLTLRSSSVVLKGKTTIDGKAVSARVWATSKTGGYEQDLTGTDGLFELEIAGNDLWRVSAIAEVDRCVFKSSDTPIPVGTKSKIEVNLELFAMRSCLPDPVSMSSDAAKPMVLENETGVKVAIPGNAGGTDGSATLSITPEPAAAGSGAEQFIGHMYDVRYMRATGEEVNSFNSNLTLSFPYDRVELERRGVRPGDLAVKYKTGGGWKMLSNCILDEENELLTCSDNHLTEFAIVAPTKVLDVKSPASKAKVSGATVTLSIGKYDAKKISHLKIYRSNAKGDLGTVIAQKVTKTAFADKPKKGKTFFYTVRAIDKAGNESSSLNQVKVSLKK